MIASAVFHSEGFPMKKSMYRKPLIYPLVRQLPRTKHFATSSDKPQQVSSPRDRLLCSWHQDHLGENDISLDS